MHNEQQLQYIKTIVERLGLNVLESDFYETVYGITSSTLPVQLTQSSFSLQQEQQGRLED